MRLTVILRVLNPKSGHLFPVSLSNGTELGLGDSMGGHTGTSPVLNHQVFKSVNGDLFGLPILVPLSSFLLSLPNLLIPGSFSEAISKQYLDIYITVPHNYFGTLKFVSYLTIWLYF